MVLNFKLQIYGFIIEKFNAAKIQENNDIRKFFTHFSEDYGRFVPKNVGGVDS